MHFPAKGEENIIELDGKIFILFIIDQNPI